MLHRAGRSLRLPCDIDCINPLNGAYSVQVERELLSEDCLRQWLPLTLVQRSTRIMELCGAHISP